MGNEAGYEGLVKLNTEGLQTLSLLIGGVHCAVCIQKIESAVLHDSRVQHARLNFSTGRLSIVWDGSSSLANEFAAKIEALGYGVYPYNPDAEKNTVEKESRFLLLCLGVAGFAAGNIMLLSVGLWATSAQTMGIATRDLLHWISALIAIPAIVFSGRPFFLSAWAALRNRSTNMDVPISVALILATAMSIFEMFTHGEHVYFDSAIMLMFFLLIGRYLDFRVRRSARSAATDLMQTLSGFANVVEGGRTVRVLIRDIREGMSVLVAAGERIPVDGIVERGQSSIDTSLVTGETLPRDVEKGGEVFAGTINLGAPLYIKVTKTAGNSLLSDIVRLMEKAEQGQARYVRLADRAARLYTPVVHTLAVLAFILWWGVWEAPWQDALMTAVTVLIITCPCALGLAVPVVQVLASGLLMKHRVLLKSGDALERLAGIEVVLFDKTGTLTLGRPELVGAYEPEYLQLAASLAAHSAHPLSAALSRAYDGDLVEVAAVKEHAGKGLEALYKRKKIRLGSVAWCGAGDQAARDIQIVLSVSGKIAAVFHFKDRLRNDAEATVRELESRGLDIVLVSGDRKAVADAIAVQAGIASVFSGQSPVDKYNVLERLKTQGRKVLMVGDGLNDAPVLAGADVSMAPGTAIDMAQNAADIVFMGEALEPVAFSHKIAVKAQRLVKLNFMLAVFYNMVAVPLAFAGLVTPMIAALAMSGSSLLVIANSYRLKLNP